MLIYSADVTGMSWPVCDQEGDIEADNAAVFAAQCVVRGFVDMRCLLSQLPAWRTALGASLASKLLTSACVQAAAGAAPIQFGSANYFHTGIPAMVSGVRILPHPQKISWLET